ncbi:MAG: formylglycine-generating enzyme family protein [Undibacterium sp.]|nr:formylglycine-generating enzyme family protein [Opitutaceae bacterium]
MFPAHARGVSCRALIFCSVLVVAYVRAADPSTEHPRLGQDFRLGSPALAMLWIAPGTFLMSSTHGAGDDTQVTLTRGYWLGRSEVTQAQWQEVMDYVPTPSRFKGSERPVENVAWATAMIFCAKLTERERVAGRLPAGYVYTLPTVAQWEYACRAGTTGIYAGDFMAMAWHDANSGGETHPVAGKQPNAWGLHDMHGNVAEWCADWYGGYPGGRANDPTGVAMGQFRVQRGGGWDASGGSCRSGFRTWSPSNHGGHGIGLRVALAPALAAKPAG